MPRRVVGVLAWALLGCESLDAVSIGSDARDAAVDAPPSPVDSGVVQPRADGGAMQPRPCAVTAECVGACPPGSFGCACGPAPTGMWCLPTCRVNPDCRRGMMGEVFVCRMGLCLPG